MIAALDPGLEGAVCILDNGTVLLLDDLPAHRTQHGARGKIRNELDLHAVTTLLRRHKLSHVYLEQVHAMPKQGVASTFRFGESFGQLQGIIVALDLPFTLVQPRVWQRHHGVGAEQDSYRQRAVQLFPQAASRLNLKRHHNRAAALLLADYGRHAFTLKPQAAAA